MDSPREGFEPVRSFCRQVWGEGGQFFAILCRGLLWTVRSDSVSWTIQLVDLIMANDNSLKIKR